MTFPILTFFVGSPMGRNQLRVIMGGLVKHFEHPKAQAQDFFGFYGEAPEFCYFTKIAGFFCLFLLLRFILNKNENLCRKESWVLKKKIFFQYCKCKINISLKKISYYTLKLILKLKQAISLRYQISTIK